MKHEGSFDTDDKDDFWMSFSNGQMGAEDMIAIDCPHCNQRIGIPSSRSFANFQFTCDSCKKIVNWYHCPQCETGFCDVNPIVSCPECSSKTKDLNPKEPLSERIISNLLYMGLVIAIVLIICFARSFTHILQQIFLKDISAILTVSKDCSIFAGYFFIFAILVGWIIAINVNELRFKRQGKISHITDEKKFKIAFSILFCALLISIWFIVCSICSYTEIFDNKIIVHDAYLMKKKTYAYSEVRAIKIDYFSDLYLVLSKFILVMDDKSEVNIANNGIYPHLFSVIDNAVPEDAARTLTSDGYNHVLQAMPEQYREYFCQRYKRED